MLFFSRTLDTRILSPKNLSNKVFTVVGKELKDNEPIIIDLPKQTLISDELCIKLIYFIMP